MNIQEQAKLTDNIHAKAIMLQNLAKIGLEYAMNTNDMPEPVEHQFRALMEKAEEVTASAMELCSGFRGGVV